MKGRNISPPYTPLPSKFLRWGCAISFALVIAGIGLGLLTFTNSKNELPVDETPPMVLLDYVYVPPEPEEKPPPPPPPKKKPEKPPEPEEIVEEPPVAEAPVEPAPETPVAPDLVSAPEPPPDTTPSIVIAQNVSELDNTNFGPIVNKKPKYPWIAREVGIEGEVDVEFFIDENGKVEKFTILKTIGHSSFAKETRKVVPHWRFPPPRKNGKKVKVRYRYTVEFLLH